MDKMEWLKCLVSHKLFKTKKKNRTVINGKNVMSIEQANTYIYNRILDGKPFMVCRFGSTELRLLADVEAKKIGLKWWIDKSRWNDLNKYSGFFPNDIVYAEKFADTYFDLLREVDLLATWNNVHEDYMHRKYSPNADLTILRSLEPWYNNGCPWTYALRGKKVLLIHPFADTIQRQYEKREFLFADERVLPKFELKTIKAVQTLADITDDRFETWFDALEYMHEESKKIDYDIAILGCGAYGLPLAAMIKADGKQAIHMGGATQLLFGIKGNRWDAHPVISKLYNNYWVRPGENETFKKSDSIEGGCYW